MNIIVRDFEFIQNKFTKFIFCILIFILASTFSIKAQINSTIEIPQLILKNSDIELNLAKIGNFFGAKKKGMNFPICKMVFTKTNNGHLSFSVEGVENSWSNLFRHDQISYGFVIVDNRMFVVMGLKKEELDLNDLFYGSYTLKRFDKHQKPPTWNKKIPIWHYEQNPSNVEQFKLVLDENLEVLE